MWTRFMDMHSGGGQKEPYTHIYIEAPEKEAKIIFYNRFGHNPDRVTCTCCGEDYSIEEMESLSQLTGYDRNCKPLVTPKDKNGLYKQPDDPWFRAHYYLEPKEEKEAVKRGYEVDNRWPKFGKYMTLAKYKKQKGVLFIYKKDIKPGERKGEVPVQGYVWQD